MFILGDDYWIEIGRNCVLSDDGIGHRNRNLPGFNSDVAKSLGIDMSNYLNGLLAVGHDQNLLLVLNIILGLAADNLISLQFRLRINNLSNSDLDILAGGQDSLVVGVFDLYTSFSHLFYSLDLCLGCNRCRDQDVWLDLDHFHCTFTIDLHSFHLQRFSLLALNDHGVFLGGGGAGHLNSFDVGELEILYLTIDFGNQLFDFWSIVLAGWNGDGGIVNRLDILDLSLKSCEVNDGCLLGNLVLSDGNLLRGIPIAVLQNHHVFNEFGTFSILKALNLFRADLDAIMFESVHNYFNLDIRLNFVGGDCFCSIVVFLNNSSSWLGYNDFSLINELKFS